MSYYCSECVMNWWPFQADQGCCPQCGGGTQRQQVPASDDAEEKFEQVKTMRARADNLAKFEAYYAKRENDRDAA